MDNSRVKQTSHLTPPNIFFVLFSLGLIIFGVRLELIKEFAVITPYWDDYGIGGFLAQHLTQGVTLEQLFQKSNDHRMLFNKLLNLSLFNLNQQQWDPLVQMIANSLIWVAAGLVILAVGLKNRTSLNTLIFSSLILWFWLFPVALINLVWGIQSHNYFMILFVVAGCWLIQSRPLSINWWMGLTCLLFASFTMGGGSFAVVSVTIIYLIRVYLLGTESSNNKVLFLLLLVSCAGLFSTFYGMTSSGTSVSAKSTSDFFESVFKTLSSPHGDESILTIFFLSPIIWLFFDFCRGKVTNIPLASFALSVAGYAVIIAFAIGYSRGAGGYGPTRRYFEFLALYNMASFIALSIITTPKSKILALVKRSLTVLWLIAFIVSIPRQYEVLEFTMQERAFFNPIQEKHVRNYLVHEKREDLENRPYRHVPYPYIDRLADLLDKLKDNDILPYQLQVKHLNADQAFIAGGNILPSKKILDTEFFGQKVVGSFNLKAGGANATGSYSSEPIYIDRPYLMIPILGYLGQPGTQLELVDEITGKRTPIKVSKPSSVYAEVWRQKIVKAPSNPFRIVATDSSQSAWFSFGAPRSIGSLSYLSHKLLKNPEPWWQIGLLLLIISLRRPINSTISPTAKHEQPRA